MKGKEGPIPMSLEKREELESTDMGTCSAMTGNQVDIASEI